MKKMSLFLMVVVCLFISNGIFAQTIIINDPSGKPTPIQVLPSKDPDLAMSLTYTLGKAPNNAGWIFKYVINVGNLYNQKSSPSTTINLEFVEGRTKKRMTKTLIVSSLKPYPNGSQKFIGEFKFEENCYFFTGNLKAITGEKNMMNNKVKAELSCVN